MISACSFLDFRVRRAPRHPTLDAPRVSWEARELYVASRRIEEQIDGLVRLRGTAPASAVPALRKGLADRVNIVVAKAAQIAAELPAPEVLPDLLRAFNRFFQDPTKSDPQCWGKNAIARALIDLGHRDSAAYLQGAAHIQME